MTSACPTCGRRLTVAKSAVPAVADTRTMSETELYAYYKRTAPLEDVRFTLTHAQLSPNLRARFQALEERVRAGLGRADAMRAYVELQDAWRAEANGRQRAAGDPGIGTPAWFTAFKAAEETEYYRALGQVYMTPRADVAA